VGGAGEADQLTSEPGGRRLGLSIPLEQGRLEDLPALVREAEEFGFTDAWSMEVNRYDAFSPLAAAAAVTGSLRLGTAIAPALTRPAGLIAMEAAGLAALAPGRFVLGLGSSTQVVVESWLGVAFQPPLQQVREVALAVRRLLSGERLGNLRLASPPEQPVPIYLAALGDRMLRLAGELAEGVIFFLAGPRIIPRLLEGVGRPLDSVARIPVLLGEPTETAATARRLLVAYALVPYYARLLERQGFAEEVQAIAELWQAGDRAAAPGQVSDSMLAELVLRGDVEQVAEGVGRYRAAGLGTPALAFAGGGDLRPVLKSLTDRLGC